MAYANFTKIMFPTVSLVSHNYQFVSNEKANVTFETNILDNDRI